jgi:mannose-1-phosphate guanylyltransferase
MILAIEPRKSNWCIVIADDCAPECVPYGASELYGVPVQYGCLGGSETLLQRALQRATSIAPASQVLVTALQEYRDGWEPLLRGVCPENRFITGKRSSPLVSLAAAILSIAKASPSSIVTILPARCYVGHEGILRQALRQAACDLVQVPEGAATLGMLDFDEGVDEDYMMVSRAGTGRGLAVHGIARRPTAWVARHLRRQGAVVCSGIMIGYASIFAVHIAKHWPGISQRLSNLVALAGAAQQECEIPTSLQYRTPGSVLKSLPWQAAAFPQRVFTVCDSGWSSLKSPHAVARIAEILANRVDRLPGAAASPLLYGFGTEPRHTQGNCC